MALKGKQPTKSESKHMSKVADLGCIVCRRKGIFNPAEIHHTQGKTKPDSHFLVLPLCFEHHRMGSDKEPISRHPYKKRFEDSYGKESDLLEEVSRLLEDREILHEL